MPSRVFVPTPIASLRPAVLVAASEPDLCQVLRHVLSDAAYDPAFATDGIATVMAVARHVPDALVLDLHLARLDGLLTLEIVRAIAGSMPVVLISPIAGPAIDRVAERLGVLAVLRKPFRNADLLDAVARALARGNGGGPAGA